MGIQSSPVESMGLMSFWCNKKVFITGHTGFKGGWLSLWLNSLGAEVHGYALPPPTNPNLFDTANVKSCLKTNSIADIRDLDSIKEAIGKANPDIVFHLAAQPLVRQSYVNPLETYTTNVIGTVNLLEAIRQTPSVRAIVNVTTDKCYENREWIWPYREDEAMGGYDPYSSSKGCVELVTSAYRRSFFVKSGVALASARAGNVIGGGDWAEDRLIPDFLRSLGEKNNLIIRSPDAIRPWQHVLEPLSGYILLAERLHSDGQTYATAWNFGPREDDAKPVKWIVEKLLSSTPEATWQLDQNPQPHEANYLKLDSSKARSMLNWQSRWDLETALSKTVDWHRSWQNGDDMRAVCLKQIQEYVATAS
jgi:CDP-glucose 4,6-dehydratase